MGFGLVCELWAVEDDDSFGDRSWAHWWLRLRKYCRKPKSPSRADEEQEKGVENKGPEAAVKRGEWGSR